MAQMPTKDELRDAIRFGFPIVPLEDQPSDEDRPLAELELLLGKLFSDGLCGLPLPELGMFFLDHLPAYICAIAIARQASRDGYDRESVARYIDNVEKKVGRVIR